MAFIYKIQGKSFCEKWEFPLSWIPERPTLWSPASGSTAQAEWQSIKRTVAAYSVEVREWNIHLFKYSQNNRTTYWGLVILRFLVHMFIIICHLFYIRNKVFFFLNFKVYTTFRRNTFNIDFKCFKNYFRQRCHYAILSYKFSKH